jgi:multiple sugar transport system permease protein/cellobiose transport system permease protein
MMNRRFSVLCIYVVLILVTLFAVSPFWFMFIMGTYRTQELSRATSLLPGPWFFQNLKTIIASGFLKFYWNSIYSSVLFTLGSVFLSVMAGYGFAKFDFKGNKTLYAVIVASMMIPAQLGLIGYVIQMRNMRLIGTLWPVMLGDVATCFGVFWMTQYIKSSLPDSIIDSARLDGCGEFRIFWQIVLPYVMPATATLVIVQFVFMWNSYLRPLVTLSDPNLFTIPLGIASLATRYQTDFAAQICALTLGTLPLIIVFLFGSKTFILGLTSGAVKG